MAKVDYSALSGRVDNSELFSLLFGIVLLYLHIHQARFIKLFLTIYKINECRLRWETVSPMLSGRLATLKGQNEEICKNKSGHVDILSVLSTPDIKKYLQIAIINVI